MTKAWKQPTRRVYIIITIIIIIIILLVYCLVQYTDLPRNDYIMTNVNKYSVGTYYKHWVYHLVYFSTNYVYQR